ncbi:MAG: HD domain-containing protein, partial [Polaribacter sp.]
MTTLITEIEKYVFNLLNSNLDRKYVYHNLAHTQRVVKKTKELAENLKVAKVAAENLEIAAWFHDTGFTKNTENHEEESIKIVTQFLEDHKVTNKRIEAISSLILATKMNYLPKNDLEKIIIDADCAHLASKNFFDYTSLLRKEWELTGFKNVSDIEWVAGNIDFFTQKHRYNTEYALKNWTKTKEKNLSKLIKNHTDLKED